MWKQYWEALETWGPLTLNYHLPYLFLKSYNKIYYGERFSIYSTLHKLLSLDSSDVFMCVENTQPNILSSVSSRFRNGCDFSYKNSIKDIDVDTYFQDTWKGLESGSLLSFLILLMALSCQHGLFQMGHHTVFFFSFFFFLTIVDDNRTDS